MEAFQQLYMLSAQHPGFHNIQKSADDNCHVTLTLVIKRSGWLCHILCWRWPEELLALARRWSRSLVIIASLEITLLRYVSRWPLMVIWGGLYTASGEFWWSETSVFFRLMVRPNAWAALAKWSTIVCTHKLCVQFKDQLLGRLFFGRGGDGD